MTKTFKAHLKNPWNFKCKTFIKFGTTEVFYHTRPWSAEILKFSTIYQIVSEVSDLVEYELTEVEVNFFSDVSCNTHTLTTLSTKHSRWAARATGIWLRIMPVCNRTWTYYLPQNHSAFHLIPFGLTDRNSVWFHCPCQPPQTDMPPPRDWWVG